MTSGSPTPSTLTTAASAAPTANGSKYRPPVCISPRPRTQAAATHRIQSIPPHYPPRERSRPLRRATADSLDGAHQAAITRRLSLACRSLGGDQRAGEVVGVEWAQVLERLS